MAKKFGNTWWGNAWLCALDKIDLSNRLPRGASYARSGHVTSIELTGNTISARVAGTRPTPYKVTIRIPAFSEEEKKQFVGILRERPMLVAQLANGQMSPELAKIADAVGMEIFPKSWKDLGMTCSCPDYALPCKHLAAVVYLLSREIDNDPFLIFRLHGFDLMKELEDSYEGGLPIPKPKPISNFGERFRFVPDDVETKEREVVRSTWKSKPIDMTQIPDLGTRLCRALADAPSFSTGGDFREYYEKMIGKIRRGAKKVCDEESIHNFVAGLAPRKFEFGDVLKIRFNGHGDLLINGHKVEGKERGEFIEALLAIPIEELHEYDVSVEALARTLGFALHLLCQGAIVPLLARREKGKYFIIWRVAMMDETIGRMVEKIEEMMPDSLVQAVPAGSRKGRRIYNQLEILLSWLLTVLVEYLKGKEFLDDNVKSLFFGGETLSFEESGETNVPTAINTWLQYFNIDWMRCRPLFVLEETQEGDAFDLRIYVGRDSAGGSLPVEIKEFLHKPDVNKEEKGELLTSLSSMSRFLPGLADYIDRPGILSIRLSLQQCADYLVSALPMLRLLGAKVAVPASLENALRPRPTVAISSKGRGEKSLSYVNLENLLQFSWEVAIGDERVSLAEFNALTENARGLVRFKNQYIYVDETDLMRLHTHIREMKPLSPVQLLQTALSGEYDGVKVSMTPEVENLIRQFTTTQPEPLPEGLHAAMRPYQERGYSWMWRNMRIGFGSIIADDMGLGKTLQVITLLLRLKQEGALDKKKALVVAPTGLLNNWQAEIEKFAPSLTSFIYHGTNRALHEFRHDVMLTSYGIVRSDLALLKKKKWQVMVIDEAQNIKNPNTAQSKAVRSLPADARIAMSGTPVENRLSEYWSIMDYVNHGYLGTAKKFQKEFARPIQIEGDTKAIERFRKITAPLMMRRMKTDKDIIHDLPDKIEENRYSALSSRQAALYQEVLKAAMAEIEGMPMGDNKAMFKRQGLVLQMILALKQVCNHPAQFLKNDDITPSLSGKVEMLLDLLETIVANGEKVLVFTQFREMGEILQKVIETRMGRRPMFYHGGCSINERTKMVDTFQNDRRSQIFLLSLRAAGTGLNLTAASHVIHFDLWWNPAVEAQATDRAYRIGQDKNVMVHRFITRDTFEERIDAMIQQKKELADLTVTVGESWIGRLSNQELHEIFDR